MSVGICIRQDRLCDCLCFAIMSKSEHEKARDLMDGLLAALDAEDLFPETKKRKREPSSDSEYSAEAVATSSKACSSSGAASSSAVRIEQPHPPLHPPPPHLVPSAPTGQAEVVFPNTDDDTAFDTMPVKTEKDSRAENENVSVAPKFIEGGLHSRLSSSARSEDSCMIDRAVEDPRSCHRRDMADLEQSGL